MPEPYGGMTDILLSYDTDIDIENGDLMTTTGVDYINREIYKVLITAQGDWKFAPLEGADIKQFLGNINSRQTAQNIKEQVENAIRLTVSPGNALVRVIPTDENSVVVFIDVFSGNEPITSIPFNFSFIDGFKRIEMDPKTTKPTSDQKIKVNDITNARTPNKYWARRI